MPALQTEFDFAHRHLQPSAADVPCEPASASVGRLSDCGFPAPAPVPAPGPVSAPAPVRRPRFTRSSLELVLQRTFDETLQLVITDNERTMISTRRTPGLRQLRLHHMFLDADASTLFALQGYLDRSNPFAGDELGAFIERNSGNIRRRTHRRIKIDDAGTHHDLRAIFDTLNAQYFSGRIQARITWSRRGAPSGRRRRSIKLGSYNSKDQIVRVHPSLDARWIPEFFVAYIVYHEMLHQRVPPRVAGGRRELHGPEFSRAERAFAQYDEAIAWEKANLRRLLRS